MTRKAKCTTTEGCKRCLTNPRRVCVACAQRRRRAVELAENDGLSTEAIAARMGLSVARVDRLFEEAAQILDLQQYKCDTVPVNSDTRRAARRRGEAPPPKRRLGWWRLAASERRGDAAQLSNS